MNTSYQSDRSSFRSSLRSASRASSRRTSSPMGFGETAPSLVILSPDEIITPFMRRKFDPNSKLALPQPAEFFDKSNHDRDVSLYLRTHKNNKGKKKKKNDHTKSPKKDSSQLSGEFMSLGQLSNLTANDFSGSTLDIKDHFLNSDVDPSNFNGLMSDGKFIKNKGSDDSDTNNHKKRNKRRVKNSQTGEYEYQYDDENQHRKKRKVYNENGEEEYEYYSDSDADEYIKGILAKGGHIRRIKNPKTGEFEYEYYDRNGALIKRKYKNPKTGEFEWEFYDTKGRKIRRQVKNPKTGEYETEYLDANGNVIKKKRHNSDGNDEYDYFNEDGKLIRRETKFGNGAIQIDHFNQNGKIIKRETINQKGEIQIDHFDDQGRLVKRETKNQNGENQIDYFDEKRRLISRETELKNGDRKIDHFDANGRLTKTEIRKLNGDIQIDHFDKNGKLTKREKISQYGDNQIEYFDKNGKMTKRESKNQNGDTQIDYFDENGKLSKRETTNEDGQHQVEYFDEVGKLTKKETTLDNGDIQVDYYDENGKLIQTKLKKKKKGKNGKFQYEYDESNDDLDDVLTELVKNSNSLNLGKKHRRKIKNQLGQYEYEYYDSDDESKAYDLKNVNFPEQTDNFGDIDEYSVTSLNFDFNRSEIDDANSIFIEGEEFSNKLHNQIDFDQTGLLFENEFKKLSTQHKRLLGQMGRLQIVQKRNWLLGIWKLYDKRGHFTDEAFWHTLDMITREREVGDDNYQDNYSEISSVINDGMSQVSSYTNYERNTAQLERRLKKSLMLNGLVSSCRDALNQFMIFQHSPCSGIPPVLNLQAVIVGPRFSGKTTFFRSFLLELITYLANTTYFKSTFIVSFDAREMIAHKFETLPGDKVNCLKSREDFYKYIASTVVDALLVQRQDLALFKHSLMKAFLGLLDNGERKPKKLPKPISSQDYLRRPMQNVDKLLLHLHELYIEATLPKPSSANVTNSPKLRLQQYKKFLKEVVSLPIKIGKLFGFDTTLVLFDHFDITDVSIDNVRIIELEIQTLMQCQYLLAVEDVDRFNNIIKGEKTKRTVQLNQKSRTTNLEKFLSKNAPTETKSNLAKTVDFQAETNATKHNFEKNVLFRDFSMRITRLPVEGTCQSSFEYTSLEIEFDCGQNSSEKVSKNKNDDSVSIKSSISSVSKVSTTKQQPITRKMFISSDTCGGCPTFVSRFDDICIGLYKLKNILNPVKYQEKAIILTQKVEFLLNLLIDFKHEDDELPPIKTVTMCNKDDY